MELENEFSQMAMLLGERARAVMLWNLLDGRAYTATELSLCADISSQAASNHLLKLVEGNILAVEKQGRHRYYRFASPAVAQVVESMAGLLSFNHGVEKRERALPEGITYARTCYDHLAGNVGVRITDALVEKEILLCRDKRYEVGTKGGEWFKKIGVESSPPKLQRRSFAHQCLDWSERRHHLAGALGASLLTAMIENDWIRRMSNTREVIVTPIGKMRLKELLSLEL